MLMPLTQQNRLSATYTPPQLPESPQLRHTKNQLPARISPSAQTSPSLPRSQTSPELRVDTNAAKSVVTGSRKDKESAIESDDSPQQEICRSPSWSNHDKERRKEEKKRLEKEKETERGRKKEGDTRTAKGGRTGKRLSKKPPAAMDTQRMPFSLRRSSQSSVSSQEPSQERSSRSSKRERRSSITSIVSMMGFSRSSSRNRSGSPSPSPKDRKPHVVESAISQIGKFVGKDKRSSAESATSQTSKSSAGDKLYDKELIQFAYQLQASADATQNISIKPLKEVRGSSLPKPTLVPTEVLQKSAEKLVETPVEEPLKGPLVLAVEKSAETSEKPMALEMGKGEQVDKPKGKPTPKMPLRPILRNNGSSDSGSTLKSPKSPNSVRLQLDDLPPTKKAIKDAVADDLARFGRASALPNQRMYSGPIDRSREKTYTGPQLRPQELHLKGPYGMPQSATKSYDGSSYVHKQRMYQQQRSIANYNAELAIEDAGELINKPESTQKTNESPPPASTPKEASQKAYKIQKPVAGRGESSDDREFVKDMPKWYHKYLRDEPHSEENKENRESNQKPKKLAAGRAPDTIREAGSSRPPTSESLIAGPQYSIGKFEDSSPPASPGYRRLPRSPTPPFPAVGAKLPSSPKLNLNGKTEFEFEVSDHSSSSVLEPERQLLSSPNPSLIQPHPNARPKFSFEELHRSNLEPEGMLPGPLTNPVLPPRAQKSSLTQPRLNSRPKFSFEDLKSSAESVLERRGDLPKSPTTPTSNASATRFSLPLPDLLYPSKGTDVPSKHTSTSAVAPASNVKNAMKHPQEVVIEGVDGDGVIRKTSLRKPRSDPELIIPAKPSKEAALDFLPELKHQPLTKPKRSSAGPLGLMNNQSPEKFDPYSQFPVSSSRATHPMPVSSLSLMPNSPFASPNYTKSSSSNSINRTSMAGSANLQLNGAHPMLAEALNPKPIAKMFVICCKCKYWHDLPSRLYEAMALPRKINDKDGIPISVGAKRLGDGEEDVAKGKAKRESIHGKVFTTVKCPWCEHGMSTACCAGWTAVVYLHERHH